MAEKNHTTFYKKHRTRLLKEKRDKHKANRILVLSYYSENKVCCRMCGYSDERALCLDHIDNDGNSHRREISYSGQKCGSYVLYVWIVKNKFPKGFQVLCCNCNMIKEKVRIEDNL